jgi:hypothetical protein
MISTRQWCVLSVSLVVLSKSMGAQTPSMRDSAAKIGHQVRITGQGGNSASVPVTARWDCDDEGA